MTVQHHYYPFCVVYYYAADHNDDENYEAYAFDTFFEMEHDIVKAKRCPTSRPVRHSIHMTADAHLTSVQKQRLSELGVY